MSKKYVYDNFTIIVNFKSDFTLSITASQNFTGDSFINQEVQLSKIKKETIIAALSRKNQKNIKCQFNVIDIEPKKLIISFIVSFDFLPTFSEQITLDQIIKKGSDLNKAESAEIRNDLEELQRNIETISDKSSDFTSETSHLGFSSYQILQKQLVKGSYLLEISGYYGGTTSAIEKNDLIFTVNGENQKSQTNLCMHTNCTYGFPYFFRKDLTFMNNGILSVSVSNQKMQSMNLHSNIISIRPILKI